MKINQGSYWKDTNEILHQYPYLSENINCDIAIIGGGLTGVIAAYYLAGAGVSCALLAPQIIGSGMDCSGILDCGAKQLSLLKHSVGIDSAAKVYQQCQTALDELLKLSEMIPGTCALSRRDSFYYTDRPEEKDAIREIYLAAKYNQLPVELIDKQEAAGLFSFPVELGILSKQTACELDPYRFCQALAMEDKNAGVMIYENTPIAELEPTEDGVLLTTSLSKTVRAKKVIITTGESSFVQPRMLINKKMHVVVSAPVPEFSGWPQRCILSKYKDSSTLRTTCDNRILLSDAASESFLRHLRQENRYGELVDSISSRFPGIHPITPEYLYSYRYVETQDMLPIIGPDSEYPGYYFAFCPGDMSPAYSVLAGMYLTEFYLNGFCEELQLFSPCEMPRPQK